MFRIILTFFELAASFKIKSVAIEFERELDKQLFVANLTDQLHELSYARDAIDSGGAKDIKFCGIPLKFTTNG